jgi:hypothetical protein
MSLRTIGPTSGKWSKIKLGKRSEASYRIDTQKSGGFLPVIHWRHEQHAEQQSFLLSCDTQQEAAAAAERILAQLGYKPEGQ